LNNRIEVETGLLFNDLDDHNWNAGTGILPDGIQVDHADNTIGNVFKQSGKMLIQQFAY
jgi:hypothetical protein